MIATFRETWRSLQDLHHGDEIVKKSLGQVLWYWTKYLILAMSLGMFMGIAAIFYFSPQLPGILNQNLPDLELQVADGRFSTNVPQPFIQGDEEFVVMINEAGDLSDLDPFQAGILLLEDKLVAKSENDIRVVELAELNGLDLSKELIINWVENNQPTLILLGLVGIVLVGVVAGGLYWLGRALSFFVWSLLIWVAAIAMKKGLNYLDAVKLTVYASVLPFLLSLFSFLAPNQLISWLTIVVFLFYSFAWVYNLKGTTKKMSTFSASEVVSEAFKLTKANFGFLLKFGLVVMGLLLAPQLILLALQFTLGEDSIIYILVSLVVTVFASIWLQPVVQLGIVKVNLNLIDGLDKKVSDIWLLKNSWGRYLGASLLISLIVMGGLLGVGLVGGIAYLLGNLVSQGLGILLMAIIATVGFVAIMVVSMRYMFFQFFLADKQTRAVESLKSSWSATRGNLGNLILLSILLFFVNFIGILLLGVGLIFTIPMTVVAQVLAYRKLVTK